MGKKKKPITNKVVNQQDIASIVIDSQNELVVVNVELYLEESDTPDVGMTSISNKTTVRKTFKFSELTTITALENEIDSLV